MTRKSPRFAPTGVQNWQELYTAALFEADKQELPSRIADAERALVLRARELFAAGGDNGEEGEAIDDALYALHALAELFETGNKPGSAASL